jgi:hypothetical protein
MIIILLGLTAVFPQWLDLKDMILAGYKMRMILDEQEGIMQKARSNSDLFGSVLSYIHQTILGEMPDKPTRGAMFSGIFQLIWLIATFVLYVIFLVYFVLVISLNYTMVERVINIATLPVTGKIGVGVGLFICSLALSLFIWPYLTAIAVAMFLYSFYALEWLFSLG